MNVNDMKMDFRRIDLIKLFAANYWTFIIIIIIITNINFDLAVALSYLNGLIYEYEMYFVCEIITNESPVFRYFERSNTRLDLNVTTLNQSDTLFYVYIWYWILM